MTLNEIINGLNAKPVTIDQRVVTLNDKVVCQIGRRGVKDAKKFGNVSTKTEFFTRAFAYNGHIIEAMTAKSMSAMMGKIAKAIHSSQKGA